jgi:hypothetical protein
MILDGLPHGHLMLAVLSILSVGHELLVVQDLRLTGVVLLADVVADRVHVGRIVLWFCKARHCG